MQIPLKTWVFDQLELITGNRYLGWLLFVAIVFVLWWVLVGLAILVALWREKHFPES